MAMFTIARLALRRSPASAPRVLGAGLRQVAEDPSSRRLLHCQLLPRLFSDASDCNETPTKIDKHFPPSGSEIDADLEREYQKLREEKRKELIRLLIKAIDTCEPAHRDLIIEKHKEVQHVLQEYLAKARVNGQKTHNAYDGATGSEKAAKEKKMNFGDLLSIIASSILLGLILSELESKWSRKASDY